ncbi:MAG: hypothetical protein OCC46_08955 [Pseudodesulfovibrio sp.]
MMAGLAVLVGAEIDEIRIVRLSYFGLAGIDRAFIGVVGLDCGQESESAPGSYEQGRFCVRERAKEYVEFRRETKYMVIPDQDMYDLRNNTLNEIGRKGYAY